MISVQNLDDSESGLLVLQKLKWAYSDAYMPNNVISCNKLASLKAETANFSDFTRWRQEPCAEIVKKNKRN